MKDLQKKIQPYLGYIIALVGGGILPFAFSPYNIGIAGIVSPGLLLWSLAKRPPGKAFLIGWCYGLAMFGLGVNWVYVSIHDYGYTSATLAIVITAIFVMGMALYPALMAYLLNKYFGKNNVARCLIVFPALWTVFEILRGWVLTGFPWLYVGYSQMNSHLDGFAPIGGVWLVSWAAVFVGSLIYCIVDYFYVASGNKKFRNQLFAAMFAIWAIAFGCHHIIWTHPTEQKLGVGLVQGNIAQLLRWDPHYVASIVQTYETLTQQALKSNVIVWPEGAIPIPLPLSQPFFQRMSTFARTRDIALFSGVPSQLSDQEHYTNSLIGVGLANGIYNKEHLVPFGEYVPLERILRGLIAFFNLPMSSFVPGPSNQEPLVATGFSFAPKQKFSFAPAICYEIAYPIFVQQMSKNADFILTISNDTWFGTSIGPAQHLQIAAFRALETGKYVIRATNTGYTAIIEPNGAIQAIANPFEATILSGNIAVMEGRTWWVQYGIWTLFGGLAITLALGCFLRTRQKD